MIKMLKEAKIPVRKAEVGHINKLDVTEAQNVKDDLKKVIFAFNVKTLPEADEMAHDLKIKIFSEPIIYKIFEDYKEWTFSRKEREIQEKLDRAKRPVKVKILKGCIFRASKPCVVGVEVEAGFLKKGVQLMKEDGTVVGTVKEIQKEGKNIDDSPSREKVAISMDEPTAGRTIDEDDVLIAHLTRDDKKLLKEVEQKLSVEEKELLKEEE
jgi:translation initiation factor 5B